MILVRTPNDLTFNYAECEELFNESNKIIEDDKFNEVVKKTYFYAFYIAFTNELIGCIYYYVLNNKLFLNGFAKRKHHFINVECLKESLSWWDCDIYAEAINRMSALCLLRAGFKRKNNNIFIYRRKNNGKRC